jgi:hypothetical protein
MSTDWIEYWGLEFEDAPTIAYCCNDPECPTSGPRCQPLTTLFERTIAWLNHHLPSASG